MFRSPFDFLFGIISGRNRNRNDEQNDQLVHCFRFIFALKSPEFLDFFFITQHISDAKVNFLTKKFWNRFYVIIKMQLERLNYYMYMINDNRFIQCKINITALLSYRFFHDQYSYASMTYNNHETFHKTATSAISYLNNHMYENNTFITKKFNVLARTLGILYFILWLLYDSNISYIWNYVGK